MFDRTLLRAVVFAASAASVPAVAQTGAATASADASYPRTISSGENGEIDYGPGPRANIVGGGAVVATGGGEDMVVRHLDPSFAQAPRPGLVPVAIGSGENGSLVWVPAGADRTRRPALVGGDGSLLAEAGPRRGPLARRSGDRSGRG